MTMKKQSPISPYGAGSTSKQSSMRVDWATWHMYNILMHTTHRTCQSYVIVVCKLDFEAPEVLKASCIFLSELQCLPGFSQRAAFRTGTLCLLDDLRALLLYEYNLHGSGEPKLTNSSKNIRIFDGIFPEISGFFVFFCWKKQGKKKTDTFMASAMVISSYSSMLEKRGTWRTHAFPQHRPKPSWVHPNRLSRMYAPKC